MYLHFYAKQFFVESYSYGSRGHFQRVVLTVEFAIKLVIILKYLFKIKLFLARIVIDI